jgi:hypothetical protein
MKFNRGYLAVKPRPDIETSDITRGLINYASADPYATLAYGEVVYLGAPTLFGPGRDLPDLTPGDIVVFCLADRYEFRYQGRDLYRLSYQKLVGKYHEADGYTEPLLNHVVTVEDTQAWNRAYGVSRIYLPEGSSVRSGRGGESDELGYTYEVCVAHGPGRYVSQLFSEVPNIVGTTLLLSTARGIKLGKVRITPYEDVIAYETD